VARTNEYQHFCVVARSLEVIGEKWSLLIVRDLLRGPQRFSDLLRYMGNITPKWLTLRLRDLEAAGIVERDSVPGRREVWYRLTPKGRDLAPVVRALAVWGAEHASRPPREGERIFPEQVLAVVAVVLNERGVQPRVRVAWRFNFDERALLLAYRDERWRMTDDDSSTEATLTIRLQARDWVEFLNAEGSRRDELAQRFTFEGSKEQRAEFQRLFRRPMRARPAEPAPA